MVWLSRPSCLLLGSRLSRPSSLRPLCRWKSNNNNNNKDNKDNKDNKEDDAFGVYFDDGSDKTGPQWPPLYKRDAATGRVRTDQVAKEFTQSDKELLQMDAHTNTLRLLQATGRQLLNKQHEKDGIPTAIHELGRRVRQQDLGLSTIGRSVEAVHNDTAPPLASTEFGEFQAYMSKMHGMDIDETDILPNNNNNNNNNKHDSQTALTWLSQTAQRQMDPDVDDNIYSDLHPADLNIAPKVNRQQAKTIPRRFLHHNNIQLLQQFLSPTATILHRIQTRLGAKDQRKIAKLIKRARNLGLLPVVGQFKVEHHGWRHAKDIHTKKPWEKELERRGLVVRKNNNPNNNKRPRNRTNSIEQ